MNHVYTIVFLSLVVVMLMQVTDQNAEKNCISIFELQGKFGFSLFLFFPIYGADHVCYQA